MFALHAIDVMCTQARRMSVKIGHISRYSCAAAWAPSASLPMCWALQWR